MKALTVRMPWATLIATGQKTVEVRSWRTAHRGDLVICSSASVTALETDLCDAFDVDPSVRGCVQAIVRVVDCRPMTADDITPAWLDHLPRDVAAALVKASFAWVIEDPRPARIVQPVRGALNLWTIDPSVVTAAQCGGAS